MAHDGGNQMGNQLTQLHPALSTGTFEAFLLWRMVRGAESYAQPFSYAAASKRPVPATA
jgi:hypothetical protein